MKKKLLFYYELFFAGGTEHSILKIAKKLHSEYELFVAYDNEETTDVVLSHISNYAKVINLNEVYPIDVDICICCSQKRQIRFSEFSKKVVAKKYLYWAHILLFETYPHLEYYNDFMENIDTFVCVSEPVKKVIVNKYPKLNDKCVIIKNYVDQQEVISKSNAPLNFTVDKNCINIISLSRLAFDKGFHRMKILCDILDSKSIKYNWYVLGKAFTQEIENSIKDLFKENPSVKFLGYSSNPYPYVKQMDYLALLSDRESWGLAITEALMLGLPCIVTNFEVAYEQIIDGTNGIILDLQDTDSYNSKITDIVNLKNTLKDNVNTSNYNMDYTLDEWKELLKTVLEKND